MQTTTTVGLDIAKSVFQVHGIDEDGNVVVRRTALTGQTHGCSDHCCTREESSCQPGAVHTWPIATDDA